MAVRLCMFCECCNVSVPVSCEDRLWKIKIETLSLIITQDDQCFFVHIITKLRSYILLPELAYQTNKILYMSKIASTTSKNTAPGFYVKLSWLDCFLLPGIYALSGFTRNEPFKKLHVPQIFGPYRATYSQGSYSYSLLLVTMIRPLESYAQLKLIGYSCFILSLYDMDFFYLHIFGNPPWCFDSRVVLYSGIQDSMFIIKQRFSVTGKLL